jgi:hypothetical protein
MQDKIGFLRRRHASLFRAIENLEHNFHMIHDFRELPAVEFKEIQDRIEKAISEAKAIRTAIGDKADEIGGAS